MKDEIQSQISALFQDLTIDEQIEVMSNLGYEPIYQPVSDNIYSAVLRLISSLKRNTKYQKCLAIFLERGLKGVSKIELKKLSSGLIDVDNSTRDLLNRINIKLNGFGYKLRRVSFYWIVPIDDEYED